MKDLSSKMRSLLLIFSLGLGTASVAMSAGSAPEAVPEQPSPSQAVTGPCCMVVASSQASRGPCCKGPIG